MRHPRFKKGGKSNQSWGTPPLLVQLIAKMAGIGTGQFDIDVCALAATAKARRFFSPDENGLLQPWDAKSAWCNPPFAVSQIRLWAAKANLEVAMRPALCVAFMATPKSDQDWWHELMASGHVEAQIDAAGRIAFMDEFGQPGKQQSMPTTIFLLRQDAGYAPRRGYVKMDERTGNWTGQWYGDERVFRSEKFRRLV